MFLFSSLMLDEDEEISPGLDHFYLIDQKKFMSPVSPKSQNNLQNAIEFILSDDEDYSVKNQGLKLLYQILSTIGTRRISKSLNETLYQKLIELMLNGQYPMNQKLSLNCIDLLLTIDSFPIDLFIDEVIISFLFNQIITIPHDLNQIQISINILNRLSTNITVCSMLFNLGIMEVITNFDESLIYGNLILKLINSGLINEYSKSFIELIMNMIKKGNISNFQFGIQSLIIIHEKACLEDETLINLIEDLFNDTIDNRKTYGILSLLQIIDNPSVELITQIVDDHKSFDEKSTILLVSYFSNHIEFIFQLYRENLYTVIFEIALNNSFIIKKFILDIYPDLLAYQFYETQAIIDTLALFLESEETDSIALSILFDITKKYAETNHISQFIEFISPYLYIIDDMKDSGNENASMVANEFAIFIESNS